MKNGPNVIKNVAKNYIKRVKSSPEIKVLKGPHASDRSGPRPELIKECNEKANPSLKMAKKCVDIKILI